MEGGGANEGNWRWANYGQLRSRKNNNNNGKKKRRPNDFREPVRENTHIKNKKKLLPPAVKNFRKITIATTELTAGGVSRGENEMRRRNICIFMRQRFIGLQLWIYDARSSFPTSCSSPSPPIVLPAFQRQKPLQNKVFPHCLLWFSLFSVFPFPLRNQKLLENWIEMSYVSGRVWQHSGRGSLSVVFDWGMVGVERRLRHRFHYVCKQ